MCNFLSSSPPISTVLNNLAYQQGPGGGHIATGAFETTTGAAAFDAPFGPLWA